LLDVGDKSDEVVEGVEGSKWISIKAVLLLILGTLIAAAFADPLVDAVDNFSDASGIPTFFISFIALPLATNSSEAVTAIIFASRDKRRTASLTFSEVCFLFPLSLYMLSAYTIFSKVNVDTFFFFFFKLNNVELLIWLGARILNFDHNLDTINFI
jgi:Ca2+/H+ antiporter